MGLMQQDHTREDGADTTSRTWEPTYDPHFCRYHSGRAYRVAGRAWGFCCVSRVRNCQHEF